MINKKARNGVIALLLLFSLFLSAFFLNTQPIIIPEEKEPVPQVLSDLYERILSINDMIDEQMDIDTNLINEFNSGSYSFESPLIVINPYHVSPLTAVILFETEEPTQVSLTVHGRSEDQSLDYVFENFETKHTLPIYGLYGGSSNLITLTITDQQGKLVSKEFRP